MRRYRPGRKKDSWESIRKFAVGEELSNLAEEVLKQPPGDLDVARFARDLAAEPARRVPPWDVPAESLPFHTADCGYVHRVGPYDCACEGVDRYLSQH